MADLYGLTEADIAKINELISVQLHRYRNTTNRPEVNSPDRDEILAPEVYLAKTPVDGVPALDEGPDTGTSTAASLDDIPGVADCQIYRCIDGQILSCGFTKEVVNIHAIDLPPNKLVLVARDKWGTWYFTAPVLVFAECP